MTPTIKTVEERQDRPCEVCVYYRGIINVFGKMKPVCNIQKFLLRDGGSCGRKTRGGHTAPCDSNFTPQEMQELIAQHNANENAVENYK